MSSGNLDLIVGFFFEYLEKNDELFRLTWNILSELCKNSASFGLVMRKFFEKLRNLSEERNLAKIKSEKELKQPSLLSQGLGRKFKRFYLPANFAEQNKFKKYSLIYYASYQVKPIFFGLIRPKKVRQPKPKMANVMGVGIIGNGIKRIKIETPDEISKRENLNETVAIFVSKQLRGDEKNEKNFDRLNTVAGLLKDGLLKPELNHIS